MNIEEAIKIVKKIRQDYNLFYPMDRKEVEAVETLLTAYEKEKEFAKLYFDALDTILNLIKKQSKEIELKNMKKVINC